MPHGRAVLKHTCASCSRCAVLVFRSPFLPETSVIEKLFAAVVLLGCGFLAVRLALGERKRRRLDSAVLVPIRVATDLFVHWRRRRAARRLTAEAIARARHAVGRDDNVVRPKQFQRPRKPH